ncbi:MAG: hypothetical protein AAF843_12780 [Bacteroidota bacterium]
MKQKTHTFFTGLCIATVYCICINQFTFTDAYMVALDGFIQEHRKEYHRLVNKYNIALGEENPAGNEAKVHFHTKIIPQMFRECSGQYFSIFHFTESTHIPPEIDNWYEILYKQGHDEYYSTYMLYGFDGFHYEYEVEDQTDTEVQVLLTLNGKQNGSGQWYMLGKFWVYLDYTLAVQRIVAAEQAHGLPIYGDGIYPGKYSCEFLQANEGQYIQ